MWNVFLRLSRPTCSKQHFSSYFFSQSREENQGMHRCLLSSPGETGCCRGTWVTLQPQPSAWTHFSPPSGKPLLSSLGYISASVRCSWQVSYKLLLILSMVMKLGIMIANCHFRHHAVNQTLFSKLPSWESSQSYRRNQWDVFAFMFSQNSSLALYFFPLLITEVFLTAVVFYIANAL